MSRRKSRRRRKMIKGRRERGGREEGESKAR